MREPQSLKISPGAPLPPHTHRRTHLPERLRELAAVCSATSAPLERIWNLTPLGLEPSSAFHPLRQTLPAALRAEWQRVPHAQPLPTFGGAPLRSSAGGGSSTPQSALHSKVRGRGCATSWMCGVEASGDCTHGGCCRRTLRLAAPNLPRKHRTTRASIVWLQNERGQRVWLHARAAELSGATPSTVRPLQGGRRFGWLQHACSMRPRSGHLAISRAEVRDLKAHMRSGLRGTL
jgi:PAS domain-containing protein